MAAIITPGSLVGCLRLSAWLTRKPDISNNVGPVKQFLSRPLQSLKRVLPSACWVVFLVGLDDFGSFVI